jgi:mono/diheme cytochrome c family protein
MASPAGISRVAGAVYLSTALQLSLGSGPGTAAGPQADWTIPAGAADLANPLDATPDVLKQGVSIFESRCRLCHGPEGKGNGPLSDPAHPAADLTAGVRADLPPDGVLFYRVWNGKRPMPAFKSELTREEVWAVVAYVKTLRPE